MLASMCLGILVSILALVAGFCYRSAKDGVPIRVEKRTDPKTDDYFWLRTEWVANWGEFAAVVVAINLIWAFGGSFVSAHPWAHVLGFLPMVAIVGASYWMLRTGARSCIWNIEGVFIVALGVTIVSVYLIGMLLYYTIWALGGWMLIAAFTASEFYRTFGGLAGIGCGIWLYAGMPLPRWLTIHSHQSDPAPEFDLEKIRRGEDPDWFRASSWMSAVGYRRPDSGPLGDALREGRQHRMK